MTFDDRVMQSIAEALTKDVRLSNEWRAICEVNAELEAEAMEHAHKKEETKILS